ncbi:hypothetical protein D3C75_1143220 [compost metagenome]
MVSPRPYHERKNFDDALLELQEHVETQFDTAIVIKFSCILNRVRDIYPQERQEHTDYFL